MIRVSSTRTFRQARGSRLPSRVSMTGGSRVTAAAFSSRMEKAREKFVTGCRQLMKETVEKWVVEAKKRVPYDTGVLYESIEGVVEVMGDTIMGIVGSSIPWAVFVEWGTRYIAGGRVYALGLGPDVTDAEAIKMWPAKAERGGGDDQMPWLRPSWWAIEPWFMEQLQYVALEAFRD